MTLKNFAFLLLIGAICGCGAQKAPEATSGTPIKKTKETIKNDGVVPKEAP